MKDTATPLGMVSIDAVIESNLNEVVVAYRSAGSVLPYPILEATFQGAEAPSVAVIENDAQYGEIANGSDVEILALPTDAKSRREILAEWASKAAKKNKQGLVPVMLLPLAACGGGGGRYDPQPFSVAEEPNTAGKWVITPAEGGSVTILQDAGGTNYVITPSTGTAETVAIASVGELSLAAGSFSATVAALETVNGTEPVSGSGDITLTALEGDLDADLSVVATSGTKTVAVSESAGTVSFAGDLGTNFAVSVGTGSTLSTSASTLDGQSISGAGAVDIAGNLSDDLSVDLSNISTSGAGGTIAVTETAGGVFTSDADLGKAAVTITGGTMDLQAAGVSGVDSSTFVVNAGELVLTHAQVDAVSNTAAITGTAGSVTVIVGSDSATGVAAVLNDGNTQSTTVLVKVDMSGPGTLKFDLPSDDNDTLVLEAGSVINFGAGGTLIVDDGNVDARNLTNASDFAGVDNVRVNSGLSLTVSQLQTVQAVETSGSGSLSIVIESEADIPALKSLISASSGGNPLSGTVKPALTLETKADAAGADALETALIAEAEAIAEAAQIAVPVKTLAGGIIYTSPSIDVLDASDSGLSKADNISTDATPSIKIILPNQGVTLTSGDKLTVTLKTYDTQNDVYVTVGTPDVINLDAVEGSVTRNVYQDANGNSYVLYDNVALTSDGGYFISVVATDVSASKDSVKSNVIKYTLDTTAPTATVTVDDNALAIGETAKVTVTFSEKVAGFDPAADLTLSDAAVGTLSKMTSSDGGLTWVGTFTPAAGVASGSTTITLTNESYSDAAGNLGAAAVSESISVDTKAPDAPTMAAVSTDNLISEVENDAGFSLSGTGEAGATVKVSGFLTGSKSATVDGSGDWSVLVAQGDLALDGSTMLSAIQTDAAGNKSGSAASLKLTTDVTVVAPDFDAVSTDNLLNKSENDAGFDLTGTGEVGAAVTVTGFVTADKAATVGADGAWSVSVATGDLVENGDTALSATQVDVAGNPSAAGTLTLSTDLSTPSAPTIAAVSTDDLVNAAEISSGITLSGTGEAGATVTVSGFETADKTATVDVSGDWSVSIASGDLKDDAANALSATQSDAAGNVSAAATRTLTTDVTVAAPTINAVSADNLVNASENSGTITLSGTGEVGASVTVTGFATGVAEKSATVLSDGTWSVDVASGEFAADAASALSATQTDEAGNVSSAATLTVTTDLQAPSAPGFDAVSSDDLINAAELSAGFNLTGTGEAGATVAVTGFASGVADKTATVASDGSWSIAIVSADLDANSANALSATQTDAAGNTSAAGTTTITTDTAVVAPTFNDLARAGNIVNKSEADAGITLSGTVEAGASVTVSGFETADKSATVASDGTWSLTVSTSDLKADAANELTAVQTDDAGNVSSAASFTVTTDFSVDTPVITAVSSDNIVGASEITGSATVTLSGTGEAGAAVTVTGGAATKTDTVNSDGSWSVDLSSADLNADATTDFSVTQTDLVGNVSTAATVTVTTDLQAPAAPAINDVSTDNLVNAFENSGGFNLTGTGEADATVTVSGFVTGAKTATVGSGGTWSVAVAEGDLAPNADTALSATQADVAGNTSVASATKIVTTDLVGASPTVSVLANSGTLDLDYLDAMKTSGEDVFASGTAENGATVTVSLAPTIEATTTADASTGAWSINVSDFTPSISTDNVITVGADPDTLSLAHGSDYTVSVKIQDVAGNTSSTVTETLTIDTPPLKVTVNDTTGVVTVAGTATGKLEVTVAADGTATFARYDAAGTTKSTITDTVADFYGKQFVGTTYNSLTDLEITVDGGKLVEESLYNPNLAAADVRYVIVDAPEAEKVVLKGDLGTAAQKNVVIIRVADDNVGALRHEQHPR